MSPDSLSRRGAGLRASIAILALASPALFSACTTLREPVEPATALASRAVANNFSAAGRIAVRVVGDTSRGFSGGFSWSHSPGKDVIELLNPLGQIAARLTVDPAGAAIELADGRQTFASDPQQFMLEMMGVSLPLDALPYWMQAAPLPTAAFQAETDNLGRPTSLRQNGWQIQYTGYADESVGANPARMQLAMGDVEARLVISEWNRQ